jgi:adenylate kinase
MNRTAIVTGVSWSGKTTVCSRGEKLAKNAGIQVNVINYGTVMMELPHKDGRKIERNNMRKFSVLMAGANALHAGAPVKIVINAKGKDEEAAREILEALEVA